MLGLALAPLIAAFTLLIPASPASAASVVPGLATCAPGPGCHYGPVHASYPNYQSICSDQDCNFVSAANLIQVVVGLQTSVSTLRADFALAGQSYGGGLSMTPLWSYWTNSGIDGVYLVKEKTLARDKADLENEVLGYRGLIAVTVSAAGAYMGTVKFGGGTAIMVVDGFTPKGPLVVYQDRTIQMTWAQWNAQSRSVWGVTTTMVNPTPPPPPSTALTATLSLSDSTVPATGDTVTLTFTSTNATICTLASLPSLWTGGVQSVSCNGTYQVTVVPATEQQQWMFTFTASNAESQSATATQTLIQEAPPPPAASDSTNWSGYQVNSSSAVITGVSGDWTVPTLNCSDGSYSDDATWVGIGGAGGASGPLLQTGVEDECVDGVQQDSGWWEEFPSTPNYSYTFSSFSVAPGDSIAATVYQTVDGSWEACLSNLTTGTSGIMVTGDAWGVNATTSCTGTFTVQGSTTGLSYSGGYTAEWIVEDDTSAATEELEPFANFGSVTWTDLETSLSGWSLTQDETNAIVQNGVTLATPTASTTDGFTDSYTGP